MPRVVIRCDGGTDIGMGHVVRCIALAQMIEESFEVHFVIQETDEIITELITSEGFTCANLPRTKDYTSDATELLSLLQHNDIVVLDGYFFKTEYQQRLKNCGFKIVAIDDLHAWHQLADVVINHASGITASDYNAQPKTKLALGLQYALLRKSILAAKRKSSIREVVHTCIISMGASDVHNNTFKFANALLASTQITKISLLVSEINPHLDQINQLVLKNADRLHCYSGISGTQLGKLIEKTDLMICPASTISIESCAVGIVLLTGHTAENQKGILTGLEHAQAAINLGDLNLLDKFEFMRITDNLISDIPTMNDMLKAQSVLIDGRSGERIKNLFQQISLHD